MPTIALKCADRGVNGENEEGSAGFDEVEKERNVACILDLACRNESNARGVEKLWTVIKVYAEVRANLAYVFFQVTSVTSHSLQTYMHVLISDVTIPFYTDSSYSLIHWIVLHGTVS